MTLYPAALAIHICAICLSGALFFSRSTFSLLGAQWPRSPVIRRLSYAIDTVLLGAAVTLVCLLPSGVFSNQWLFVKLMLVAAYILFGIWSMRSNVRRGQRWTCCALALFCYLNIIGIAITHNPFGWFSLAPWH